MLSPLIGRQPPSGGCVLKPGVRGVYNKAYLAATFGWLCVETGESGFAAPNHRAATFGWLCVETKSVMGVESILKSSHLRVAVC